MKLNKISQALAIAACFAAASASASTVTQPLPTNTISLKDTNWNDFLNFQKFDTSLGTLTSVQLDLYSNVKGHVDVMNFNDDAADVPLTLDVTVSVNRPDATSLVLINAPVFNQTLTVDGGGGYASLDNSFKAHNSATFGPGADLDMFKGTGTLSAQIFANANSSTADVNIFTGFSTQADGYGTVTYTYTAAPVPEPETYGMLLLGLGLMGVVAKRKQARAKQA